jgi:hypothetical protein
MKAWHSVCQASSGKSTFGRNCRAGFGGLHAIPRLLEETAHRIAARIKTIDWAPATGLPLWSHQSEGVLGAEDMAVKVGDPLPARRRYVQVRHGLL